MMPSKVFCIGFHKTGTSSLTVALRTLGYRVTGPNGVRDPEIARNAPALVDRLSHDYDAFQDNPWPLFYERMDRLHPGSKFILTIRNSEKWLASVVEHFGGASTPMRRWIYGHGDPVGHETVYVSRYEQHNASVRRYFEGRPDDLLLMRMEDGYGWEPLCRFLAHEVPAVPFPHVNRAEERTWRNHVRRWLGG
jgi:hypothetical protein